jgi:hypothetical protein
MTIKNQTDRTLDIQVNGKSSQTLWNTDVMPGDSVSRDLPDSDAPFTALGRWKADPPLQNNFLLGSTSNVPNNKATVTVTLAFPGFLSSLST